MVKAKEIVFIDTGVFKALVDGNDDFHNKAVKIWKRLESEGVILLTTNYVIDETFTLVRVRCGLEKAKQLKKILVQSTEVIKFVRITAEDEMNSWQWFEKDWSKLSMTDCVSFAVMKRLKIKRAASFDKHFERAGFSLEK